MKEAFESWWAAQDAGLGDAYKFTAWNAWREATNIEREACAKVCQDLFDLRADVRARMHSAKCADAIRARSNAK